MFKFKFFLNVKIMISFLFIFALLIMPSVCLSSTYYVDATNGNDGNSGILQNEAWKTISKINSSTFQPGDQILLKRGEIWSEQLIVPNSGSLDNPITFGAYGNGDRPIIDGINHTLPGHDSWQGLITGYDRHNITIENIAVKNSGTFGIKFSGPGSYIKVHNCLVESSYHGGIIIDNFETDSTTYITVTNNLVTGNNFYDCQGGDAGHEAITLANVESGLVSGNTVYSNCEEGICIKNSSNSVNVYNNTCYANGRTGIYISAAKNVNVFKNVSYDNFKFGSGIHINNESGVIDNTSNIFIYNNLIYDNENCGIKLNSLNPVKNIYIYNNTIYQSAYGRCVAIWDNLYDNIVIKNNIFYYNNGNVNWVFQTSDSFYINSLTIDYNCYYHTSESSNNYLAIGGLYYNLLTWQASSGQDTHSIIKDPLFVNASNNSFLLKSGSPCIDAGTPVGLSTDFAGIEVPKGKGVDIGAFEYKGLSPPTNFRLINP